MKPTNSWSLTLLLAYLPFAFAVAPAVAQELPVIDPIEDLDFDTPEAWAMKLYASVSLLTSLGPVEAREPGSVEIALEGLSVPHLDREQRTVGFGGRKEEDLNRTPVWGRGRVTIGLPWKSAVTLAWAPPVRLDGVEASLISAALEKNLLNRGPWTLGVRLYGQVGTVKGDLTCTQEDSQAAPGSPANAFGCEAPSEDEVTMDYLGVEVTAGYALMGRRAPHLHLGVAGQRLDTEFQVSAQTFGFLDRSLLRTEGETFSIQGGATWQLAQKARLSLEAFYSPLSVQRLGQTSSESDDLLNLRAMVRYRLR